MKFDREPLEEGDELPPPEDNEDEPPPGDEDADNTEDSDDPPAEDEDEDEEDPVDPPPRKVARGDRQFGRLRNENRKLRSQLDRVTGSVEALTRTGFGQTQRQRDEDEAARIAAMEPEERVEHLRQRDRTDFGNAMAQQQFRNDDRADRAEFKFACIDNPAYARVKEQVERELTVLHAKGQRVDREILAQNILGRKVAEKEKDRKSSGERQQQRRRAPAGGGSDVQRDRGEARRSGGKGKTPADRLSNVKF